MPDRCGCGWARARRGHPGKLFRMFDPRARHRPQRHAGRPPAPAPRSSPSGAAHSPVPSVPAGPRWRATHTARHPPRQSHPPSPGGLPADSVPAKPCGNARKLSSAQRSTGRAPVVGMDALVALVTPGQRLPIQIRHVGKLHPYQKLCLMMPTRRSTLPFVWGVGPTDAGVTPMAARKSATAGSSAARAPPPPVGRSSCDRSTSPTAAPPNTRRHP